MLTIWSETRHPDLLGGHLGFQTDSLILKYVGLFLFFTWPSLFALLFLNTSLIAKLAVLFLFIILWGPVFYVTLILSAIFKGGVIPDPI